MLLDDKQPVGFLGLLFSRHPIHGQIEEFCDLAAWIVKEEYRSNSLALLFPLLKEKNLTITTFTASNRVITVLKKLGFQDIETELHFLLPVPIPHPSIKVIFDKEKIAESLDGDACQIFSDHRDLHCWHALIKTHADSCYIMLNCAQKKASLSDTLITSVIKSRSKKTFPRSAQ